ncbi:MAG TPA: hypothetical protein VIN71_06460, partial [Pseudomonadales bacterium]
IHSGLDPLFDQDQDGVPNFRDSDSDGDLIPDIIEAGTDINGVPRDTDGDGVADFLDIDSDGDGIPDIVETMPYSVDSNNNGIADVFDAAIHGFDISPAFQGELVAQLLAEVRISEALASGQWLADQDNDGVPNYRDIDSDGDGIPDALEGTLGRDTLANGIDDMYDVLVTGGDDNNGDGIDDAFPCHDTDGDGQCDYLDSDSDNDCISDFVEAGASGHDFTLSGYDDAFDACFDGDGKHDGIHSACLPDSDGDGAPDHRDLDSDNDAIIDVLEAGRPDDDGNGQCDAGQALITDPAALPDSNNDSIPDLLSLDSNGDGVFDIAGTDHAATDSNNDGRVDPTGDADKDGIDDRVDNAPNRFGLLAFDPEDPDFCDNNPDHPDCEEPVDCDADPDHPDCDTPVDCDADPDHPDCDTPVDCDADPDHPDCDTPVNPVQPGFGKIKTTEQGSAGLLLGLLAALMVLRRRLLA